MVHSLIRSFKLFLLLILISSCAKVGYLAEQGIGQISLLTSARDNSWVINDPETPENVREKIKQIEEYKSYFEDYWDFKTGRIYTRTTFLEGPAVTYLLIASPKDRVSAKKECFPIQGCFPYLGFFHQDSAKSWAKRLEREGYVTFIRPVYAYSTLGYFNDTILSSFFIFDEFQLAELIFHELFHTMFFIKDEVSFNEALATYFGREMVFEYFDLSEEKKEKRIKATETQRLLSREIVKKVRELNRLYKKSKDSDHQAILKTFLEEDFRPYFEDLCETEQIARTQCFALNRKWNNASFAAFLTYQDSIAPLEKMRSELDMDLKAFYRHIESKYKSYLDLPSRTRRNKEFASYLLGDNR